MGHGKRRQRKGKPKMNVKTYTNEELQLLVMAADAMCVATTAGNETTAIGKSAREMRNVLNAECRIRGIKGCYSQSEISKGYEVLFRVVANQRRI